LGGNFFTSQEIHLTLYDWKPGFLHQQQIRKFEFKNEHYQLSPHKAANNNEEN